MTLRKKLELELEEASLWTKDKQDLKRFKKRLLVTIKEGYY